MKSSVGTAHCTALELRQGIGFDRVDVRCADASVALIESGAHAAILRANHHAGLEGGVMARRDVLCDAMRIDSSALPVVAGRM